MTRRIILAVVILCAGALVAQTTGNLYGGYSFVSNDLHISRAIGEAGSYSANGRGNLNGWNFSGEIKVFHWIGATADFNGAYGSVPISFFSGPFGASNPPNRISTTFYTYLFGPRVSMQMGKIRPFAEVLLGVASQSLDLGILDSGQDHNFAFAVGGELDYRVLRPLAWRIEGDYVHTSLFKGLQVTGHTPAQQNFRLSTGIVVRF
jgi:hypothetical protein